jgi:hypothetical protein
LAAPLCLNFFRFIVEYVLTDQDVKGPFIDKLPAKLEDKKSLKRLNYTSPREALGEHFHMSEDLLAEINPGKKFDRAGDKISAASLSADKQSSKVSRIEVDKGRRDSENLDEGWNSCRVLSGQCAMPITSIPSDSTKFSTWRSCGTAPTDVMCQQETHAPEQRGFH